MEIDEYADLEAIGRAGLPYERKFLAMTLWVVRNVERNRGPNEPSIAEFTLEQILNLAKVGMMPMPGLAPR